MSHSIYLGENAVRRPQPLGNPLLRKIQRACRASLHEPDLAVNLDIADYINEKQGASSRDAVVTIVKLINSRDPHTAIFALALLDVLVKNCGYPVHLQISRKEFLNELVRRFPEHPPIRYSRVQRLILTAIEEWYQTICKHADYKQDLGYIRDMHRLLKYKSYVFPKIDDKDLAVLKPSKQLKTASELQKEQEIKQAAKLEELIRRGKPEDLREANKLMKVMAGFKEDNIVQVKQAMSNELSKLKRKADIFNEMLSSTNEAEIKGNETLAELYSCLRVAQPKFQQIIGEEHEDDQFISDMLSFNDSVNQLLNKYEFMKNGKTDEASRINVDGIADSFNNNSISGALAKEINLIDFDSEPTQSASPSPAPQVLNNTTAADPIGDLLGDFGDLNLTNTSNIGTNFGMGGNISLGSSKPAEPVVTKETNTSTPINSNDLLGFDDDMLSKPQPPVPSRVLVHKSNNLKIEALVTRISPSTVRCQTFFSNVSIAPVSDLTFSQAVPKAMNLQLDPQTDNYIASFVNDGVHQIASIENALADSVKPIKIKWKVNYNINNSTPIEETAIFTIPKV